MLALNLGLFGKQWMVVMKSYQLVLSHTKETVGVEKIDYFNTRIGGYFVWAKLNAH